MRRFRVGDQVRVKLNPGHSVDGVVVKENQDTTDPRVVPTIVTRISTDYKIASLPEDVELVEAVEDQGSNPKWVEADVDSHQRGYDAGYENGLRDGKIMVLREQEPIKTMTVDEVAEMVENLLVERTEALLNPPPLPAICRYAATLERYREISKERARAVAEALVGVRVTR